MNVRIYIHLYTTVAILQTTICRPWWTWQCMMLKCLLLWDRPWYMFGWGHTMKYMWFMLKHANYIHSLHTNMFFYAFSNITIKKAWGESKYELHIHSIKAHRTYFKTDLKGWWSTWQHWSWWGCPVCCTHIEWCIRWELAHCPLHWLSLCAL